MRVRVFLPSLGMILSLALPCPAQPRPGEPDLKRFRNDILPLLQKHCIQCHGPEKARGDVTLHDLDPSLKATKDADLWAKVVEQISLGEMPPREKPKLQPAEIDRIRDWVRGEQL